MKLISKLALALTMGAIAITPAAQAQKGKKDKEAPEQAKRNYSKGFITAYSAAVDAWKKKKDVEAAKAAFPAAVAAIENDDDKYEAGVFAVNLGIEIKDTNLQKQGIDLLLSSSTISPELRKSYLFQKGAFGYDEKDYATAEDYMKQAYDLGFRERNIEVLIANAQGQQNKFGEGSIWLRRAVDAKAAAGQPVDKSWIALGANYALKAKDAAGANRWLKDLIRVDPSPAYWRDALSIYMNGVDLDLSEKLDVMRLMRLNKAMLYEQDYSIYLETVNPARYPNEAYSMLEEGFNGNIISRNSVTFAEESKLAKSKLSESNAGLAATEKEARANKDNYQTVLDAELFLSRDDYAIARDLYQIALAKGRITDKSGADQTDRTLLRLATSQIGLGEWDAAKATLGKIQSTNRKAIAEYWMIYADLQKAKSVAPAVQTDPAPVTQ